MSSKHFCEVHNSYEGFIDEDSIWHCWVCYKQDLYLNPEGEQIMAKTIGNIEIRALATSNHRIKIEVWQSQKDRRVLKFSRNYDYLTRANADWVSLLNNLERKPPVFEP